MVRTPPCPFDILGLGVKFSFFLNHLLTDWGKGVLFLWPQTGMQWMWATGFLFQVPWSQPVVTFPTTAVLGVTCLAAPLS